MSEEFEILQPKNWPAPKGYANGMSADGRMVVAAYGDGTVRWHLRHVYDKLHVRSRAQAVAKYGHFAPKEERGHSPVAR